jgi:hypothetical protein
MCQVLSGVALAPGYSPVTESLEMTFSKSDENHNYVAPPSEFISLTCGLHRNLPLGNRRVESGLA